jgi:hypothetical protein
MKVFISWSGALSQQIAELLSGWIQDVLQGAQTWISSADIDKGSLWFGEIANQLEDTSVGILCLTKDNLSAPWILFEAGALSKGLSKSRVCPLLVNLAQVDVKPPLSVFNATMPRREDMLKLIKTINAQSGEKALEENRVQKAFDMWWSSFDSKFASIVSTFKPAQEPPQRSIEDMIAEILEVTRSIQKVTQEKLERAEAERRESMERAIRYELTLAEKARQEEIDMSRRRLASLVTSSTIGREGLGANFLDLIASQDKTAQSPTNPAKKD